MTSPVPEGRYGCPTCPDRFTTVGAKKRHMREAHNPTQED